MVNCWNICDLINRGFGILDGDSCEPEGASMPVEVTQHSLKEMLQFTTALEDNAFVKSSMRMRSYTRLGIRYRHSSI